MESVLRLGGPALLAIAAAWLFDRMCARKGLTPPGFREPWRRFLALALLAGILWRGVFAPLGAIGLDVELDLSSVPAPQLFLLHLLMLVAAGAWFLLGFAGAPAVAVQPVSPAAGPGEPGGDWHPYSTPVADLTAPERVPVPVVPVSRPPSLGRQLLAQFGLVAPSVPQEIGLGVVLGVGAWLAVIVALVVFALVLFALGMDEVLPKTPSAAIPFLAGLPVVLRLLVSLSAGVVEEIFFRGFLQPRIGIVLSTAFFVLAHFSYGQPLMLVGITVLSVIYGLIVRWRQNIWPAIVAHFLFDAVQLLVMIPYALRMLEKRPPAGAGGAFLPGVL